jgi:hypothetical protein
MNVDKQESLVSSAYKHFVSSESEDESSSLPPPPLLQRETTAQYRMSPLQLPRTIVNDMQEAEIEKVCVFCKRDFYTDAEWKTACPTCYEDNRKKCECGKNLPLNAPKYKTQCTKCWLAAREKTHEKCPTCTGDAANQLRKRKDKKECLDCYNRLRRPKSTQRSTRREYESEDRDSKKRTRRR